VVGASVAAGVAGASVAAGASVGVAAPPQAASSTLDTMRSDNKTYMLRFTFLLLREIDFLFD
jgi:hypothetical protein